MILIAATDECGGIARNGVIPWLETGPGRISDMEHFRDVTRGKVCVMGRKTAEQCAERIDGTLGRKVSELSRGLSGVSLRSVVSHPRRSQFIVCGGAEIYRVLMPAVTTAIVTRIPGDWECDLFMPALDPALELEVSIDALSDQGTPFVIDYYRRR